MNVSENIARLRRAGIRVYGVVRNDPTRLHQDIASMHTKFVIFNSDEVHSGSYNLHFHLWGGNWRAASPSGRRRPVIYRSIYNAIRFGLKTGLDVDPAARQNVYYTFGDYRTGSAPASGPQDAIITRSRTRPAPS